MLAWNKVKENRGCAGTDWVTLEDFEKDLDLNLNDLEEQLETGSFKPLPGLQLCLPLRKVGSDRY